jgi:hypothetical protein
LFLTAATAYAQEAAFSVSAIGASGVSASEKVLAGAGDKATVELNATGLTAGSGYRVTLHTGTCAAAGASSGLLGEITADASGRATLSAAALTLSGSGQTTQLSFSSLTDGQHIVVIGSDQGAAGNLACGSIPRAAGGLPATGGPAGAGKGGRLFAALTAGLALFVVGSALMRRALSPRSD